MRNIKFRGRRVDGKGWAYGFYFCLKNMPMQNADPDYCPRIIHGIFDDSGLVNPVNWEGTIHRASYVEVIPESVGQYISIDDKKGKEIYTGDRVKNISGRIGLVVFSHIGNRSGWTGFWVIWEGTKSRWPFNSKDVEVISANPKLLEGEAK